MKNFFVLLLFIGSNRQLFAQKPVIQKPVIDSTVYNKWHKLESPILSDDGRYCAYTVVVNGGSHFNVYPLKVVIQSMKNSWTMDFQGGAKYGVRFTADSKYCLFMTRTDSLIILKLSTKEVVYIPGISGFNIPGQGSGEWLVYTLANEVNTTVLRNLKTGKERSFSGVSASWLDDEGRAFVYLATSKLGNEEHVALKWINLEDNSSITVWKGKTYIPVAMDTRYLQLAYKANDSIWYYKMGMSETVCLTGPELRNVNHDLKLGDLKGFSRDGSRLCINLIYEQKPQVRSKKSNLEIWSYMDSKLQSRQAQEADREDINYLATINLTDDTLIQLQRYSKEFFFNNTGDKMLFSCYPTGDGDYRESWWNATAQKRYSLTDANTGKRRDIDFSGDEVKLSPGGRYIIYFDSKEKNYISYNTTSGSIINLTANIHSSWQDVLGSDYRFLTRGIAGWMPNDEAVLLYDSYDIWELDPSGRIAPRNITNGYGKKYHIVFSLALQTEPQIIKKKERLILNAFDIRSKDNGVFSKVIDKTGDPELLTMGSYIYKIKSPAVPSTSNFNLIKAKNAEVYLVKRESVTEAPNYFSTSDFKTFTRLTDHQPHKVYNWYTTELHTWKSLDGRDLQGILYKPENFDLKQKYPVIFYFYERKSDGLNAYLIPEFSYGALDIPTYVSNGYLVFSPDIYYKQGNPMQGTYDALVSAAKYISALPFINPRKMGLQGHSYGAIQTNSLITRTNLFAAACSASGKADWVSAYGTLVSDGGDLKAMYEIGQDRMWGTLWERSDGYIKNSPIFQADKITTPLLMEHGGKDGICPYSNAQEFFLGLRRLGKKVWMLVYPEAYHTLDGWDSKDFTIRMMQFFDHYLKDKPAPLWMTKSFSAREGIGKGYQYDTENRTPGPGILTSEEQKKVDSLMTTKSVLH